MGDYETFIEGKLATVAPSGLEVVPPLDPRLFPFQRDLTGWALRRGKAAIFADTGTGKSFMELEWCRNAGKRVLILAPLAVAHQLSAMAMTWGIDARVVREDVDVRDGINITNYDRLHKFDPAQFDAMAADESAVLKNHDSKTLAKMMEAFARTPMKLCATATPSPNDYTELGTHAQFLGVCTQAEMLAEFFVHDGGETQVWRLKGHARQEFWKWVSQWAALIRKPSELNPDYSDDGYVLPPLHMHEHIIPASAETVRAAGLLFAAPARDLMERRTARRASVGQRVEQCAALVNADDERWVVWCELNSESEALAKTIRGAIEVTGSMDSDDKERRIIDFIEGRARVLLTKPSIAGAGLNLQFSSHMAMVGVSDSWERHYQSIRRIWRFGQTKPCHVHMFASEVEGSVVANLKRKEADAEKMAEELSRETREAMRSAVHGSIRSSNPYAERRIVVPSWIRSDAEAP